MTFLPILLPLAHLSPAEPCSKRMVFCRILFPVLARLYESLACDDAVQTADLIFVFAGRIERKQYGLELFRSGLAPVLLISVGRYEVSRMCNLDLEGVPELTALREQTPPDERHFFIELEKSKISIEKVKLPFWNTYGEALGLRRFLEDEEISRVIVISTDIHLRRVRTAIARAFRGKSIEFLYCPVPSHLSFKKADWWSRSKDRRYVFSEMLKLAAYRLILPMPRKLS